jgi:hypothetical protein
MAPINIYSSEEKAIFKKLDTPKKIQDFLDTLQINFEKSGETCMSPRFVLKIKKAHCMEGAMLAAAVLEFHGYQPLVVDLRAVKHDYDHVIAVFRQYGCWGAISKTNHAVLRYREPIYKTIRELVLSVFHEYFDDLGRKNLRDYSLPVNLSRFNKLDWRTSEKDLWDIPYELDRVKHYRILTRAQIKNLRKADRIEIKAGKLVEWKNRI